MGESFHGEKDSVTAVTVKATGSFRKKKIAAAAACRLTAPLFRRTVGRIQ
jgi:hypothetical protein